MNFHEPGMKMSDQLDYHSSRAARELDLALIAKSPEAARAHFSLSSLHMERVRQLSDGLEAPKPLLSM